MADENFQKIYNHYEGEANNNNIDSYVTVIKKWNEKYRGKIQSNKIELQDYLNLVNFFCSTESKWFVKLSSRNPEHYMIYQEDDDKKDDKYFVSKTYYTAEKNTKSKTVKVNKAEAEKIFNEHIRPLLKLVVDAFDENGFKGNKTLENSLLDNIFKENKTLENSLLDNIKASITNIITKLQKSINNKTSDEIKKKKEAIIKALETAKNEATKENIKAKLVKMSDNKDYNTINKNIKEIISEIEEIENLLKNPAGLNALDLVQHTKLYKDYSGKQLIIKIMVLESAREKCCYNLRYKLPIILENGTITSLYKKHVSENDEGKTTTRKSAEIFKTFKEKLGENPAELSAEFKQYVAIGYVLWDMERGDILDVTDETPNVIYYGSPGTGKTYTVTQGIKMNLISDGKGDKEKDYSVTVQCHPGFGYEEFIEGLKPVGFTNNGMLKLEPVNGTFKNLCIKARKNLDEKYYFVADEINRANLSAMFGETLSLLETDYRDFRESSDNKVERKTSDNAVERQTIRKTIETPMSQLTAVYFNDKIKTANGDKSELKEILGDINEKVYECDLIFGEGDNNKCKLSDLDCNDNEKKAKAQKLAGNPEKLEKIENVEFGIPKNIYFIGMMNDVDKSIDAFDLALRRRFKWIRKDCDYGVLESMLADCEADSKIRFRNACENLNNSISGGELRFGKPYEFGHAYFMKIKNYVKTDGEITKDCVKKFFAEHLEPVLREYIRSFKDESEIDLQVKRIKTAFLNDIEEETGFAPADSTDQQQSDDNDKNDEKPEE